MLGNLRSDPFEQAHEIGMGYEKWRIDRAFMLVPAQQKVGEFLATFKEFPPSQKVGSFSLDKVMEMLSSGSA
jgi:arylsulfatase